jgi:hypothetical protein
VIFPLRCSVSGLQVGFTQAPETHAPSAAHAVMQPPQWALSFCVSTQAPEQSVPVMQAQVPFMQACPAPQVTPAQGSLTPLPALPPEVPAGLPAILLIAPPAAPAMLEAKPPAATLIPPLASEPLPLDPSDPPAPGWAGAPLELTELPPAVLGWSFVPPELQAAKQSNEASERRWGPGFDQE